MARDDGKKVTKTVAFRLAEQDYAKIERAANGRGFSVGEFARHVVVEYVDGGVQQEISEAVQELVAGMAAMRQMIGLATAALLVDAGHAEPEEAEQWVRENLGA
jgi:hypothetical protein